MLNILHPCLISGNLVLSYILFNNGLPISFLKRFLKSFFWKNTNYAHVLLFFYWRYRQNYTHFHVSFINPLRPPYILRLKRCWSWNNQNKFVKFFITLMCLMEGNGPSQYFPCLNWHWNKDIICFSSACHFQT